MSCEVVASGIKGGTAGSKGSTAVAGSAAAGSAAAGTGAGAAGLALESLALDFFFFVGFFLPPIMEPIPPPWQQQHKQMRTIHSQIGNCEPHEPEAVEPNDPEDPSLADPEESLAQDP